FRGERSFSARPPCNFLLHEGCAQGPNGAQAHLILRTHGGFQVIRELFLYGHFDALSPREWFSSNPEYENRRRLADSEANGEYADAGLHHAEGNARTHVVALDCR